MENNTHLTAVKLLADADDRRLTDDGEALFKSAVGVVAGVRSLMAELDALENQPPENHEPAQAP